MRLPTLGGGLRMMRRAGMVDTMRAWEGFLTGDPRALLPLCNFVVSSWQRSLLQGVNPAGRSAPLAARDENDMVRLRDRHQDLLSAAAGVLTDALELFAGSRSIMILTNAEGIVLEAVGDMPTLEQGQDIHLMPGGDWREGVIGTNGIGTALAAGRPAQVHAAEHFCEGIKRWTCAAAPVFEPGTGAILGVVDISGPPMTYQRNNLALAVMAARQIEAVLSGRAAEERSRLLECCLERLSQSDAAGLIALDRTGRLVHATGRVPVSVALGQRLPGLDGETAMDDWPRRLPEGWPSGTFTPVKVDGRTIGALLVMPTARRSNAGQLARPGAPPPQGDRFGQIIGSSDAVTKMVQRGRMLAGRRVPVLIEGETGTGKELLARAMHEADDPRKPFVVLNCGALSKELMAGELFGHVRGAFTGATSEGRAGRFELEHGGTLCLDEIGE
jgi:transcriptional regulator of acetoin/glycerol metabolism